VDMCRCGWVGQDHTRSRKKTRGKQRAPTRLRPADHTVRGDCSHTTASISMDRSAVQRDCVRTQPWGTQALAADKLTDSGVWVAAESREDKELTARCGLDLGASAVASASSASSFLAVTISLTSSAASLTNFSASSTPFPLGSLPLPGERASFRAACSNARSFGLLPSAAEPPRPPRRDAALSPGS
jgi:hypothetical protein